MSRTDYKIASLLILYVIAHFGSFVVIYTGRTEPLWLPPAIFLMAGMHYIILRGTLRDPVGIILVISGLYALLPTFETGWGGLLRFGFVFDDAYYVNNISALCTLLAVLISLILIPDLAEPNQPPSSAGTSTARRAAFIASTIAIGLGLMMLLRQGSVLTGALTYLMAFDTRMASGSGVLLLSVPFGIAGMSLFVLASQKMTWQEIFFALAPHVLLFVVTAQRKYIIIPVLIWGAVRIGVTGKGFCKLAVGSFSLYIVFLFLGYMRIHDIAFTVENILTYFPVFFELMPAMVAGETTLLYATQASSVTNVVEPYPFAADYWKAALVALPQFIFGESFVPLNVRFSFAVTPQAAMYGGGWGYSFAAEGYLIGRELGVAFSTLVVVLFFRMLWVAANKERGSLFFKSFCIAALFSALWLARNAFAYTFKDLLYQFAVMVISFTLAELLSRPAMSQRRA